ncbi:MAG: ABC transporter ATP-binding protein [Burkholderiales bacterium]
MIVSASAALELDRVVKRFGSMVAVDDVSLAVARGEFIALLGPSGCGKTTTLRMIAGLEQASKGIIRIRGADVTALPTYRRDIGMVFQSLALFPHMTVAQNIGFGLRMRGRPAADIDRDVKAALGLVRLVGYGERMPASISGGQQQRVALARALAARPTIILLDEPFSALDRKLREELTLEFAELLRRIEATTVFVTHDQEEAFAMSQRVAVMQSGRILQIAPPAEVFARPADVEVARFVGMSNVFEATVDSNGIAAKCPIGTVSLPTRFEPGCLVVLGVRPEHVQLDDHASGKQTSFDATVRSTAFRGRHVSIVLSISPADARIDMLLPHGAPIPPVGERIRCFVNHDAFHLMPIPKESSL